MLQRAASNACSWWWASHIRTKQSKWLDSDIEEMEERVKSMLKIVEQDGDSFAKKAEMYFKKRPELIHFVEETYKAYKALADRYDHISSELHKANHTIATAFPDQIQFDIQEEEDDDNFPKAITSIDPSKIRKPSGDTIPPISLMNKRKENQASLKKSRLARVASQSSKDKAQEKIDKLQKGILVLQTEKEYIKSAYERGIAKYWDIENQITDMQEEVFSLQDKFSASVVIDDDDARALMAVTALKSCEDSIAKLKEQQEKSMEEARVESEKIKIVKEKMGESIESEDIKEPSTEENINAEPLCDIAKEHIEISSATSVVELAEKINELVTKVIELELKTSSQTAQIKSLSSEADTLQRHLRSIEEEKKILIDDSNNLRNKLKQAEDKFEKTPEFEQKTIDGRSGLDENSPKHNINDFSVEMMSPKNQEVSSLQNREFELNLEDMLEKTHEFENNIEDKRRNIYENSAEHSIDTITEEVTSLKDQMVISHESSEEKLGKESFEVENEYDQIKISRLEKNSTEDITEIMMLPIDWEQFDSPSIKKESIRDYLNKEVNEIVDIPNTFVEEVNSDSVNPEAQSHGVSINLLLADEHINAHNASIPEKEKNIDRSKASSRFEDDSVKSEAPKHEAKFTSSLDDDYFHPIKESKLNSLNSIDSIESTSSAQSDDISLNWLQALANKSEGKEKILLSEYTSILRNYKDVKKKLSEVEKKNQETTTQITELESVNTMKDEEIHSLKKKLRSLQTNSNNNADIQLVQKPNFLDARTRRFASFDIGNKSPLPDKILKLPTQTTSYIEEKFRRDLDTLLEENLEFWLRYSTSFHSIQRFQTTFEELEAEIKKLKHRKFGEGSSSSHSNQESLPIDKKFRELKTELQVWLEQNMLLQGELKGKFSAISSIQEEISGTLEASLEASLEDDVVKFAPYQAAKFQGELLNMQHENNNVERELKAGLEHMRGLQVEIEKSISSLHKKNELPEPGKSSHVHFGHTSSKTRVPLRSFLFNSKPKKKQSIFACVNPTLQKHNASSRPS